MKTPRKIRIWIYRDAKVFYWLDCDRQDLNARGSIDRTPFRVYQQAQKSDDGFVLLAGWILHLDEKINARTLCHFTTGWFYIHISRVTLTNLVERCKVLAKARARFTSIPGGPNGAAGYHSCRANLAGKRTTLHARMP